MACAIVSSQWHLPQIVLIEAQVTLVTTSSCEHLSNGVGSYNHVLEQMEECASKMLPKCSPHYTPPNNVSLFTLHSANIHYI